MFAGIGEPSDELIAELWERGTQGLIQEESGVRAFFEDDVAAARVAELAGPGVETSVRRESAEAAICAEGDWEPITVGERFYVMSAAHRGAIPDGRLGLRVGSSIAFGTGRHESTQLCLRAMERLAKPGQQVADIGCGSGILSMAAALLGAGRVWSCDIDAEALKTARAALSSPVFEGSADSMASRSADVVLANISARVVDRLAMDLRRIVKEDGLVIVSGFIERNTPLRFRPSESLEMNEWLCWVCRPEDIQADEGGGLEGLKHDPQWWI